MPFWLALAFLGHTIIAFAEALHHLVRHIEILGQISPVGVESSIGIPEGCAFSVACMATIAYLASCLVQSDYSNVDTAFYADNWGIIADSVSELQTALTVLDRFVASWHMALSVPKSWLWGSHSTTRKSLRDVQVGGQSFPIQLSGTDLGCDMAYTGKVSKKTSTKRWSKAKSCLGRIRRRRLCLGPFGPLSRRPRALVKLCTALNSFIPPIDNGRSCVVLSVVLWATLVRVAPLCWL